MLWSLDREAERPPLSVILPRLYLGAESDVTQERLSSLGISYVLSVSRCSPQPSFVPRSRYLRIPIDDSLWAELLPWIPQALRFIDAAMSSGASVLVHCAAGISRSPALAVAYIMYSRGMDLDHAYRFVKERRPSISPNFNFLGQLQHFQGTLGQKSSSGDVLNQQLDNRPPPSTDGVNHTNTGHNMNHQAENRSHTDAPQQRLSDPLHLTLNLNHNHNLNQNQNQTPCERPAKPTQLQLPASSAASLSEKRKSLTLFLTPPSPAGSQRPTCGTTSSGSGGAAAEKTQSRAEAKEPGLLSPFSFTINKLLDWGERLLLGGVFAHPVRMGQPALPYRC